MIYIRKKSELRQTGNIIKPHFYLQIKNGSRGSWGLLCDETGETELASQEARDAKIQELVSAGAKLVK